MLTQANPLAHYLNLNPTYDTKAMVEASVAAAKAPLANIQRQEFAIQAKISALGQFSSKLDGLNTAAIAFASATDKPAAIQAFVAAYNDTLKTGKTLAGSPGAAGPLTGDSALRNAELKLSRETLNSFGGAPLSSLGVTHEKDGTLKFDASKFDVTAETAAAQEFMTNAADITHQLTSDESAIAARGATLTKRLEGLHLSAEKVTAKAEQMRAQLQKTYAQVDAMASWMSNMTVMLEAYTSQKG